jgi:hypothetical protein
MTEEERLRILAGLGDVSGGEDELTMQLERANAMRQSMQAIKGGKTGGNIGRGAYGIAAAMTDYGADKKMGEVNRSRTGAYAEMLRSLDRRKRGLGDGMADTTVPDYSGMVGAGYTGN